MPPPAPCSISVLAGDVVLNNLQLKPDALADLDLPGGLCCGRSCCFVGGLRGGACAVAARARLRSTAPPSLLACLPALQSPSRRACWARSRSRCPGATWARCRWRPKWTDSSCCARPRPRRSAGAACARRCAAVWRYCCSCRSAGVLHSACNRPGLLPSTRFTTLSQADLEPCYQLSKRQRVAAQEERWVAELDAAAQAEEKAGGAGAEPGARCLPCACACSWTPPAACRSGPPLPRPTGCLLACCRPLPLQAAAWGAC